MIDLWCNDVDLDSGLKYKLQSLLIYYDRREKKVDVVDVDVAQCKPSARWLR